MAIKHTQLAYDDELWNRKKALMDVLGKNNVTFSKIMIAGIEALEASQKPEEKIPEKPPEPKPFMHDNGELVKDDPPEPKNPAGFLFYLDLPVGVLERSFDIFDEDQKMWLEVPLVAIPDNTMFRIREDGYVIAFQGNKHFYKDTQPVTIEGVKKLLIYPVEYVKEEV